MGFVLNAFIITVISVIIIDISGFVDNVKRLVFRLLNGKEVKYKEFNFKPFDCSFCFSFWVNLIFLIVSGFSFWGLLVILIFSWTTVYIKEMFLLLDAWILWLINKLTPKSF